MVQTHQVPAGEMSAARKGISGFFLTGLLTSFLGAILPAWRYHIEPDYLVIGTYFLCQNLGILAGVLLASRLLFRRGIGACLVAGCIIATLGLLLLAGFSPPAADAWRMAGLFLIGAGAGFLNAAVFHAISPAYERNAAATANLAGIMYGIGCLVAALLVSGTFFVYTVPSILILIALAPGFGAGIFARIRFSSEALHAMPRWRDVMADFKSPAAVLFALLLFFQFGNEGALAGWLPLFLTQRLGVSPGTAIGLMALYFLALLVGRAAGQWLLVAVSHGRLLFGSVFISIFGCLILSATNNRFGAITGVLLAGLGFAGIGPLAIEKIRHRFPYFHPDVFHGIFSLGLTGGLLAQASLGYLAHFTGIWIVMALPVLGSIMVLLLLLLIMLEGRLSGGGAASRDEPGQ